ncbi:MAG: stage V sporulation protein AA [Lachnospiraceae bacterium]|nr:stage V sporulation protein AA [Lachnospiraceae bacterium]
MADTVCYIKLNRNVETTQADVFLKDIGSIRCADKLVAAKVKSIKVHKFRSTGESIETGQAGSAQENGKTGQAGSAQKSGRKAKAEEKKNPYEEKRCVVSVLKIIELIEDTCPDVTVESLGETEVLIERINVDTHKGWQQALKAFFIALISFCGTAFTIMAYHNDIGIADVFTRIHQIVMGSEPEGVSALEIAYSVGLSLGIIVFFNHVGGRRLTKDPTPIEVEMRKYETDVNNALVDTAEREGRTIDVE